MLFDVICCCCYLLLFAVIFVSIIVIKIIFFLIQTSPPPHKRDKIQSEWEPITFLVEEIVILWKERGKPYKIDTRIPL